MPPRKQLRELRVRLWEGLLQAQSKTGDLVWRRSRERCGGGGLQPGHVPLHGDRLPDCQCAMLPHRVLRMLRGGGDMAVDSGGGPSDLQPSVDRLYRDLVRLPL